MDYPIIVLQQRIATLNEEAIRIKDSEKHGQSQTENFKALRKIELRIESLQNTIAYLESEII